jgi:hypothetical protein
VILTMTGQDLFALYRQPPFIPHGSSVALSFGVAGINTCGV